MWIIVLKRLTCSRNARLLVLIHQDTETRLHTIRPHDVLQRFQILDVSLVATEDLGPGTEIVGKLLSVPLPHFLITTQGVDLLMEGHIVGRPVTCGSHTQGGQMNTSNYDLRPTL